MDVSMYRPNAARRGCLCMIINMTATMQPSKTFTYIPIGLYDTLAIRNYDLNTVHERFHKAVPWATMSDWEATVEAAAASWSMHFTVNYCQICRTAVGVIELVRSVSFRVSTCMALKISHSTKLTRQVNLLYSLLHVLCCHRDPFIASHAQQQKLYYDFKHTDSKNLPRLLRLCSVRYTQRTSRIIESGCVCFTPAERRHSLQYTYSLHFADSVELTSVSETIRKSPLAKAQTH